jgi:hypothetical protein
VSDQSPVDGAAARRRGAHRAPRSRRALVASGALVLTALAAVAIVLSDRSGGSPDGDAAGDPALDRLAGWIAGHLADDTSLTAEPDVRDGLVAAGVPADRLSAEADDTLSVVAGDPPAGALVLARFEREDGSPVSVVDRDPGRPTAAELDRRRRLADAVLANPVAAPTGRAPDVLRAADVDARLLGLLAGMVARLDVHVADLPPAPGEPEDGPPARQLLVDRLGDEPLAPGTPAAEDLVAYLEAQRPPFAPNTVEVTDDGVLVGFHYESSPDAVVSGDTS